MSLPKPSGEPLKWDREAAARGTKARVFCASLADVFDSEAPKGARERLWDLIRRTPNLDWLLLTKRANHIKRYLPSDWGTEGYANVWLGVTCEDRKHGFPRVDHLRTIPATKRFLSCEPLLEDIGTVDLTGIDWVIVGGESVPGARQFDLAWARALKNACAEANCIFFFKQMGTRPLDDGSPFKILNKTVEGKRDSHGTLLDNFPVDLRIQELPKGDEVSAKHLEKENDGADNTSRGLSVGAYSEVLSWLQDYAQADADVLTHLAVSAYASLTGMVAVMSKMESEQPCAEAQNLIDPLHTK